MGRGNISPQMIFELIAICYYIGVNYSYPL